MTYFVYSSNGSREAIVASYDTAETPEAKALALLKKAQEIASGKPARVEVSQ